MSPLLPPASTLLRFDGAAGFLVGVGVLALHDLFARLYALPVRLVLAIGVANLVYGSYSGTLAVRDHRGLPPPRRAIDFLIAANGAWAVVCFALAAAYASTASVFGLAVLAFEGVFVGSLAVAEARLLRPQTR